MHQIISSTINASTMNESCYSSLICTERDPLLTAHAQESWRALLYHHIIIFLPIFLIFSRALIYFKYSHCYYPPNLFNNNHPIISSVLNVSRIFKNYLNLIIFQTMFRIFRIFWQGQGKSKGKTIIIVMILIFEIK